MNRRAPLLLRVALAGAALIGVMMAPQPWQKAVAALIVLSLAWADSEPWAYVAAFCIPFSFVIVQTGRVRISPTDVAVWGAFAGWCGLALRQRVFAPGTRRWTGADGALLLLFASSATSLLVARDLIAGLDTFRLLVLQPALLYAVMRFGRWPEVGLSRLADAFVLGGAALALAGLWSYFVTGHLERVEGVSRLLVPFYDSPNHISLYLGRTASVAFCMAIFSAARARRWLHAASVGVMLAAFYLTYSRAGWLLGLPAAALTIALFVGRRHVTVALAAIVLAALALVPVLATPRFGSLLTLAEGAAESRLLLWQGTERMIAAHPVLGVGIGNFYTAYPRFMLPDAWREPLLYHAHNAALDSWSMLGIVGLAAFVWLEVAFWRMALQLRRVALSPDMRALLIGLAASMAYALAHGLVDTLYFLPDLALAFMLTIGMTVVLHQADQ